MTIAKASADGCERGFSFVVFLSLDVFARSNLFGASVLLAIFQRVEKDHTMRSSRWRDERQPKVEGASVPGSRQTQ